MANWIILAAACIISAGIAMRWLSPPRVRPGDSFGLSSSNSVFDAVFLFDGTRLISHSDIALAGFETVSDWADLRRLLQRDFPTFPEQPDSVRDSGNMLIPAIDCTVDREVLCEWVDGIVRVQLCNAADAPRRDTGDMDNPIRLAMEMAPYPVWFLDHQNSARWCNAAYVDLVRKVRGQDADLTEPIFPIPVTESPLSAKTRVAVAVDGMDRKLWFDITQVERAEGRLCYAMDINAVVEAETAQRKFVQTMTKTFAQLSIGLAIFDRNRQLALFNPALIDLTTLPPDFLSCRPSLSSFFDRLRDQHMMPEPKNYRGWRSQMNDLVEAAEGGTYQETWSLPSGSVYSVSGRPHPDGAVAFLFEDITAEITLTRRFRSEMDLMRSVLDKLADAIVVFADDGTLAFSNYAYQTLWGHSEDAMLQPETVMDVSRTWQDQCVATPVLGDIRDFVETRKNRSEWSTEIVMRGGTRLECTMIPVQTGATIIRFAAARKSELGVQQISA